MSREWSFLSFEFRWLKRLIWNATGDDCEELSPVVFPDDPDEKIDLIFSVSLSEFTRLLSAIEKGATLSYPDDEYNVVWSFLRSFECSMAICEAIINCIENDVDTQQAIVDMLKGNQTFNNYLDQRIRSLTSELIATKLIAGGDCDRPQLAGRVKAIVDSMNKGNVDWFERIEAGTNSEEKFVLAVGAIPGIETLPIDDVVDFAQDLLEDFSENYDAQVDAELLQEWYCGLLCEAEKNADCSLTYGQIYQYFANRLGSGLNPFSALSDVVGFIVNGEFSGGTRVADATMAIQTGLMSTGGEFFGSGLPTLSFLARDAGTSTFYEDCDVCPDDDLWLIPVLGNPDSIERISYDDDEQVYDLFQYLTGNYLTGGALSGDTSAFYIHDVEYDSGAVGPDARFVLDGGTYELDNVPCWQATTKIWAYNVVAGATIRVTIKRVPCVDVFLRIREDGGFAGSSGTITLVGATATTVTYDVVSDLLTGPIALGVDTVESDLMMLKSAYLVSAVSLTPGSSIGSHYHEQFESIGSGAGASGTLSSKKWAFFEMSSYGQTLRLTFSYVPY